MATTATKTEKLYKDNQLKLTRYSDGRVRIDFFEPRLALYQLFAGGENSCHAIFGPRPKVVPAR